MKWVRRWSPANAATKNWKNSFVPSSTSRDEHGEIVDEMKMSIYDNVQIDRNNAELAFVQREMKINSHRGEEEQSLLQCQSLEREIRWSRRNTSSIPPPWRESSNNRSKLRDGRVQGRISKRSRTISREHKGSVGRTSSPHRSSILTFPRDLFSITSNLPRTCISVERDRGERQIAHSVEKYSTADEQSKSQDKFQSKGLQREKSTNTAAAARRDAETPNPRSEVTFAPLVDDWFLKDKRRRSHYFARSPGGKEFASQSHYGGLSDRFAQHEFQFGNPFDIFGQFMASFGRDEAWGKWTEKVTERGTVLLYTLYFSIPVRLGDDVCFFSSNATHPHRSLSLFVANARWTDDACSSVGLQMHPFAADLHRREHTRNSHPSSSNRRATQPFTLFADDYGQNDLGSMFAFGFVSLDLLPLLKGQFSFSRNGSRPVSKRTTKSVKMINGRRVVVTREEFQRLLTVWLTDPT